MIHKMGSRIQKFRKAQGMSQEEFGSILNVSRQAISKWENGDSLPDVYNLGAIARLFHSSIDELLLGTPSTVFSQDIIQETKRKQKKALLFGRVGLFVMSLILAPPLILMDALGVENPTFGAVAAGIITVIGVLTFFTVHFFVKSQNLKEELVYLEQLKQNSQNKEEWSNDHSFLMYSWTLQPLFSNQRRDSYFK